MTYCNWVVGVGLRGRSKGRVRVEIFCKGYGYLYWDPAFVSELTLFPKILAKVYPY